MGTMSTGFVICFAFFFPWFVLLVFEVLLCCTKLTTNDAFRIIRKGEFTWALLKRSFGFANFRSIFVNDTDYLAIYFFFPWETALPKQQIEKDFILKD
jgi:hypothetical protein